MSKLKHLKKAPLVVALTLAGVLVAHAAAPLIGESPVEQAMSAFRQAMTPDAKQRALGQLEHLANEGDGRAAMELGKIALRDVEFAGDLAYERALRYYERAVELEADGAGVARALTLTRRGYHLGKDTAAGNALLVQAFSLLQAEAPSGDKEILWNLGFLESTGIAGKQDLLAGSSHVEDAAIAGHPMAALWTANRYAKAIPAEPEAELRFLRIAAAGGIRAARERLDSIAVERVYENSGREAPAELVALGGLSTGQMIQVASLDFQHVAGKAPPTSTITVAAAAPTLADTLNDEVLELRHRLEAAVRELDALRSRLADAERRAKAPPAGPTVDQLVAINNQGLQAVLEGNYEVALQRFREAAQANYAPAQSNLGLLYLNGTSVPQDGRQAAKLFELAARQGNVTAAENLARIYDFGLGIHADRSRAIHWYQRAEQLGSSLAPTAIDRLTAR